MLGQLLVKNAVSRLFLASTLNIERRMVPLCEMLAERSYHQLSNVYANQPAFVFANRNSSRIDYLQKRYKKKGGKSKQKAASSENEEDEDEDDDDNDEDGDDIKVVNTSIISMRLDAIGKTCFNIARAKFDEHFYKGMVRVNGERVGKKSHEVQVGDEIDYIRGVNAENPANLDVIRINILQVDDKASSSGRIKISYRKVNRFVIKNYERDPFEGQIIS